jgi:thiamine-phosphate pyrophosphorylase
MGSRPSERPTLCLVIDREIGRYPLAETVAVAVRAGVDWIQIRERKLEGAELLAWAGSLIDAAEAAAPAGGVRAIVNRRVDLALCLSAGGVHLGFDGMSPGDARSLLGEGAEIGVSTHTPEEVSGAARSGASYAHLSPVFDPLSKSSGRPALGLEALRAACAYGLPVLAQGGIDADNAGAVIEAGGAGVAVTGAILMSENPERATSALRRALS